jgi:predicted transcriptional regulator
MTTGKSNEMVPVNVLVPRDMKAAIDGIAAENDWTLATVVRRALKEYAERMQKAKKPR